MKKQKDFLAYSRIHQSIIKPALVGLGQMIGLKQPCLLCSASPSELICSRCQSYLVKPRYRCQSCALPLEQHSLFCGSCLKSQPAYDEVFSPYLYEAPMSHLITGFKQQRQLVLGHALSQLLINEVEKHYQYHHKTLPDLIAPVPLHWYKQCLRGFNQSAILSHALAKHFSIPHFNHITRVKHTQEQKNLSRKQRLKSLHNHFVIKKEIKNQSIVIVDDVMTTGATANTLAKALKQAGAHTVSVWALARTSDK